MKKNLFERLLKKYKIDINSINDEIKNHLNINYSNSNVSIFYYISEFDGLGHPESDVDVYVYLDEIPELKVRVDIENENLKVIHKSINGLKFDIELRKSSELLSLMKDFEEMSRFNYTIDENTLKLYLRIKSSLVLNNNTVTKLVENSNPKDNIQSIIAEYYYLMAREKFDDGRKLYRSEEYVISTECYREAIINMAGAVNAVHGRANIKKKWIHKIFLSLDTLDDDDIKIEYEKLIIYPNITIHSLNNYQENLVDLYQMMVSEMSLNI